MFCSKILKCGPSFGRKNMARLGLEPTDVYTLPTLPSGGFVPGLPIYCPARLSFFLPLRISFLSRCHSSIFTFLWHPFIRWSVRSSIHCPPPPLSSVSCATPSFFLLSFSLSVYLSGLPLQTQCYIRAERHIFEEGHRHKIQKCTWYALLQDNIVQVKTLHTAKLAQYVEFPVLFSL